MDAHPPEQRSAEEQLQQVAEIARTLAEAASLDALLQRIVDSGETYLDRCDGVSLMLVGRGGTISSPAYSSKVAFDSDLAQYETNEGPCLEAMRHHETIVVDDLEQEQRWPAYRQRALELGIRSMISFRLFVREDTMGALDFYSSTPHAFGDHARLVGQVFASHAGVALKAAITENGLEHAIATRDLIGQAKGILMARQRLTGDAAFEALQAASQRLNRPVRDIADEVIRGGELPD